MSGSTRASKGESDGSASDSGEPGEKPLTRGVERSAPGQGILDLIGDLQRTIERFDLPTDESEILQYKADTILTTVHDLIEEADELYRRSNLDPNTDLLHIRSFRDQASRYLDRPEKGTIHVIGVIDIRDFKAFNDTFGHLAGDEVLKGVAETIQKHFRLSRRDGPGSDLWARWGGDEFTFLMSSFSDMSSITKVAERFKAAVAEYPWKNPNLRNNPVRVDIGMVVLVFGDSRVNGQALLTQALLRADRMMYWHKKESKAGKHPEVPVTYLKVGHEIEEFEPSF